MEKIGLVLHRTPNVPRAIFRQRYQEWHASPSATPSGVARHTAHLPHETDSLRADAVGQKPRPAGCDGLSFQWFEDVVPPIDAIDEGRVDAYRLDEVIHWDRMGERPMGTTSPGVKLIAFVRRQPELSTAEFRERYLQHAEIAREHHPGIARYVQNFVTEPLSDDAPQVDGIAELHFVTEADLTTRFYRHEGSAAVVGADVQRFMTLRGSYSILATEVVVR